MSEDNNEDDDSLLLLLRDAIVQHSPLNDIKLILRYSKITKKKKIVFREIF